jgi:hypothetical protein
MNTKHTSGKWHAKDGQIYPTETGKTLAIIPYYDKDNREQEANAKLIAAAPELLQMVYDLMNCIKRLTDSDLELHQEDKDKEAQWIGEAHEMLHVINPDYK